MKIDENNPYASPGSGLGASTSKKVLMPIWQRTCLLLLSGLLVYVYASCNSAVLRNEVATGFWTRAGYLLGFVACEVPATYGLLGDAPRQRKIHLTVSLVLFFFFVGQSFYAVLAWWLRG